MILNDLEYSLKRIDHYRDQLLFLFIKPYWPRKILPNHLTYLRIAISVLIFIMLFFFGVENKALIISLFCFGAITDLFDGSVARGLNKETEFGTMLDPIADKALILPVAFYSLYKYHKWMLLILVLLEATEGLLSMFHKSKDSTIKPNVFGKAKMVLFCVVFVAILIAWPNSPSVFFIDILWVSVAFSIISIFVRILEMNKKGYIKNKVINKELTKLEKYET